MKKIVLLSLVLFAFPYISLARQVDFSQAKIWDFKLDKLASHTFDKEALAGFESYNIETIDIGKDHQYELVAAAGPGYRPEVKIFDQSGKILNAWLAYDEKMFSGVELAVADVNRDNKDEIITGVGKGAGSHIRIFNSAGENIPAGSWIAFPNTNQGVKVTALKSGVSQDLKIAAAIYENKAINLKIFSRQGVEESNFKVNEDLGNDFKIESIDLGGDNFSEIMLAAGSNRPPKIYIYRQNGSLVNSFFAYDEKFTGGFELSVIDINSNNKDKIITSPQTSGGPHIKVIDGYGKLLDEFMADEQNMLAGLNLAVQADKVIFIPSRQSSGRSNLEKYIEIDISDQKLNFYNYYGIKMSSMPVSTGTTQMPTPLGEFTIDYKQPLRFSRAYGLYMPYWMAFNVKKGYGIHELPYWPSGYKEGINHLGQRVSHGCVRLGLGDAATIYNQTPLGTKVFIQQ